MEVGEMKDINEMSIIIDTSLYCQGVIDAISYFASLLKEQESEE